MTTWAFVDYENVGSLESLNLTKYQRLIVLCGPRHKKINFGDIPTNNFSHLEIIRMETTGKNNLDFHLSFYLGAQHQLADEKTVFHVISNDKGFDGLVNHLNSQGRACQRKPSAKKIASKAAAKKAAKKVTKKVTKKEAQKPSKIAAKKVATGNTATIIAKLQGVAQENRPNTIVKLVNWIANSPPAGNENNAKQIIGNLTKAGVVLELENGKCEYPSGKG